jgi:hypothetical protein
MYGVSSSAQPSVAPPIGATSVVELGTGPRPRLRFEAEESKGILDGRGSIEFKLAETTEMEGPVIQVTMRSLKLSVDQTELPSPGSVSAVLAQRECDRILATLPVQIVSKTFSWEQGDG